MAPLYWTFAMPSYRPKPSSGRDIATSGRNSLGASSRLGCSSNAWTTRCRWGPLSSSIPQPNGTADSASPKQTVEVERKFNCASKHAIQACCGTSQATAAVEPSGLHCPSLRNNADPFGKNILGPRAGFVPQLVGFWGLSAGVASGRCVLYGRTRKLRFGSGWAPQRLDGFSMEGGGWALSVNGQAPSRT